MQGTTYKVGNDHRRNGIYGGSRSNRGKHRSHLTILTSSYYTEDPRTNENCFIYQREDLLESLGMGKYSGSDEHSFDQSHCYAKFYG